MPERITIRSIRELTDAELEATLVEVGVEPPPGRRGGSRAARQGEVQDPDE